MKQKPVLLYCILAIGITWLLWIPALLVVTQKGYPLPTIDYLLQERSFKIINSEHAWMVLSFSLAVYGPVVAGILTAYISGGKKQVSEWFKPALFWRTGWKWTGIVTGIALLIVLAPVLLGGLFGLVTLKPDYTIPSVVFLLGLFIYQFLTSGLGEEPGWRGFLLPYWQVHYGSEKAIWWTGLVWAFWHFPFTIFFTLKSASALSVSAQLSMVIPSLIGQVLSLIGMVYIYAWLINRSKSIFLAILFHALGNTFNAVFTSPFVLNPIINLAIGAIPWLVVLLIEKTQGKNAFSGEI